MYFFSQTLYLKYEKSALSCQQQGVHKS